MVRYVYTIHDLLTFLLPVGCKHLVKFARVPL